MKRNHEDISTNSDDIPVYEVVGRNADLKWTTIEIGDLDGTRVGMKKGTDEIVAMSSRNSLERSRWSTMPSLSAFTNLRELDLNKNRYIRRLDDSICDLKNLVYLGLTRCESLSGLPENIGKLSSLKELDLTDTSLLASLPESIGDLANLQKLSIGGHFGSGNK
eukprot:CAMPEP_0176006202 /NCGR_PEP_ID=MMETSP0120_2-20121206/2598_1 /TAXON_ID=160619 /ORGANISM="Kryptoperidinium foliaceum, Strain CCMP 1326" /LENGTH=163 /DNA_ID=CAMNT_0017338929 /DNA_START=130 /DNA_END=618 /DNA_ORIENTATION=-